LLPTPAASSYGRNAGGQNPGKDRPSLETMARKGLLPTPTAGDGKSSGSRNLEGSKAHKGTSLTDYVKFGNSTTPRLWPTPRTITGGAESAERKQELGRTASGGGDLQAAVKMWPTPASRDHRHPNAKPYSERGGGKKGEQLPNAVGGALNPNWVEWLMGLPIGWTGCGVSETELYRFVRRMRIELSRLVSASQYLETEDLLE